MRTRDGIQTTADILEVKVEQGNLVIRGEFSFQCRVPEQNGELPDRLETAVETGGQEIKRRLFQQTMEQADREVMEQLLAEHPEWRRRGRKPYAFKTVFGTVRVRRQRLQEQGTKRIVIPSAEVWQVPARGYVTAGLRAAIGDAMVEQSVRQSTIAIAQRAGEDNLLSRSEVLEIVHQEGTALQAAQQARVEKVLAEAGDTASSLLPVSSTSEAREDEITTTTGTIGISETSEPSPPLGFPGFLGEAATVASEQSRCVDPGTVIVEADEVKVHAQAHTQQKTLLVYTAVIAAGVQTWHGTASTMSGLQQQVAALLIVLGVHRGERHLLFLADGARWIRNWFDGLALAGKAMILCWYHLVKRCEQNLSLASRGRAHRQEIQASVLRHLWHGQVDEAITVLRSRRSEMRNMQALNDLIRYIEERRPYLPNYAARHEAGLRIASNRVEKLNDLVISARCKHQGMAWTETGVNSLAAMATARRNHELSYWRQSGRLPSWTIRRAA